MIPKILLSLLTVASVSTMLAAPVNFAVATPTTSANQFSIENIGGTVTISATGQDFFTFLVGGTPFVGPVLSSFSLTATSTSTGTCSAVGCGNSDNFSEQGFTGNFMYTVIGGPFAGAVLLQGTFNVNGTPANSGGTLTDAVGGTGGDFSGTQSPGNTNGILMSSAFLNFAGVTTEAGSWAFSAGTPAFSVNATGTNISLPLVNQLFTLNHSDTFSSEPAPRAFTPEPGITALLGSALVGLGLLGRKRIAR
jgi:hypothetical protein